jgi:hypothetical protein
MSERIESQQSRPHILDVRGVPDCGVCGIHNCSDDDEKLGDDEKMM